MVALIHGLMISIHALRGEGDESRAVCGLDVKISIHALRGEGDATANFSKPQTTTFQSTPSVGRATRTACAGLRNHLFQSTPSVGRATMKSSLMLSFPRISIHALRGEGDARTGSVDWDYLDFNPRPPWGGRPFCLLRPLRCTDFNPRPPWGGRHGRYFFVFRDRSISIHALRGEGDILVFGLPCYQLYFNPRPPWGGRPQQLCEPHRMTHISIHALRGEGDLCYRCCGTRRLISIHALRGEGDKIGWLSECIECISIHALRGEGDCKNIQICNAMLVHSAYKTVYFCDSCAFYLT